MAWYYRDGDKEVGPVGKADLQALIKAKRISGKTMIRAAGSTLWRPLAEMVRPKQAGDSASSSPPIAPQQAPQVPPTPPPRDESPPQTVSPSATPSKAEMPFEFKGTGGEYFKVWIVNVLLSIVTLGIYSAWAKVRRKQYFHGNTNVAGGAFRYLANPVKILKGRIVVFVGFIIVSIMNEAYPPAGLVVTIAFLIALPWLVVRSLAFNARNSSWRNIRFNFTGTYGEATKVFLLWPMLLPFTLGLIGPYIYYRQKKFVVDNSAYGTTPFVFHATAKDYYRMVFVFLIPVVIAVAVAITVVALVPMLSFLVPLLFITMYLYAFAYFSVKSSNLLYNSGALFKHRFRADMEIKSYAFIVLTNTLATVVTLGFFHPFAQVRAFRYKIDHLTLLPGGDLDQFVAAELKETSALGDELSDFLDFDFGL